MKNSIFLAIFIMLSLTQTACNGKGGDGGQDQREVSQSEIEDSLKSSASYSAGHDLKKRGAKFSPEQERELNKKASEILNDRKNKNTEDLEKIVEDYPDVLQRKSDYLPVLMRALENSNDMDETIKKFTNKKMNDDEKVQLVIDWYKTPHFSDYCYLPVFTKLLNTGNPSKSGLNELLGFVIQKPRGACDEAVENGVKFLLGKNADINVNVPEEMPGIIGKLNIVDFLLENATDGSMNLIEFLLNKGAKIERPVAAIERMLYALEQKFLRAYEHKAKDIVAKIALNDEQKDELRASVKKFNREPLLKRLGLDLNS